MCKNKNAGGNKEQIPPLFSIQPSRDQKGIIKTKKGQMGRGFKERK